MSPRRNRVTPWSTFEATSARGSIMGNRGCLHDAAGRIGTRTFARWAWIACRVEVEGRRRVINAPGCYTELFFADEATALTAGHRPCAACRRGAFDLFRSAWCRAHGLATVMASEIDTQLHSARLDDAGRQVRHPARLGTLPDGVMVGLPGSAALVWGGSLHPWSHEGYGDPERIEPGQIVTVLTPCPTVQVLAAGYRPAIALSRSVTATSLLEAPDWPIVLNAAP